MAQFIEEKYPLQVLFQILEISKKSSDIVI